MKLEIVCCDLSSHLGASFELCVTGITELFAAKLYAIPELDAEQLNEFEIREFDGLSIMPKEFENNPELERLFYDSVSDSCAYAASLVDNGACHISTRNILPLCHQTGVLFSVNLRSFSSVASRFNNPERYADIIALLSEARSAIIAAHPFADLFI